MLALRVPVGSKSPSSISRRHVLLRTVGVSLDSERIDSYLLGHGATIRMLRYNRAFLNDSSQHVIGIVHLKQWVPLRLGKRVLSGSVGGRRTGPKLDRRVLLVVAVSSDDSKVILLWLRGVTSEGIEVVQKLLLSSGLGLSPLSAGMGWTFLIQMVPLVDVGRFSLSLVVQIWLLIL